MINETKQKAWDLYRQAKISEALQLIEKICLSDDADAEAMYLLGSCHARLGNYKKSIHYFEESLGMGPNLPYTYVAIGGALDRIGRKKEAIASYKKAIQLNPSIGEAHFGLAETLATEGAIDVARRHYIQACKYLPTSGTPHYKLGLLARQEGYKSEDVLSHFINAVNVEPQIPEFQASLGECLLKLGRLVEAQTIFNRILEKHPDNAIALSGILIICAKNGEYKETEKHIDKVLKNEIYTAEAATAFLLVCKHINRCDEAIEYAEICLDDKIQHADAIKNIHMQLGAVLDQQGRFDEAWLHITAAKETELLPGSYDPIVQKKIVDNLIAAFNPATHFILSSNKPDATQLPLFIIGMPRSGTSLIEQILCAHPDICGGGELTELSEIMNDIADNIDTNKSWPDCIHDMNSTDIDKFSNRYLKHINKISKSSRYVTDKMPHNFYALGLIRILFPYAKIIHCKRQALDNCLSIYFQNFLFGHDYAKNLFHLGTHHHQYQRLMQHWRESYPDMMLEIDYEALVESPEVVITDMLEYCGLEWNDKCLQFHTLDRRVDTASFDQVRQPIHAQSVGKWRDYKKYLDELKDGLERGY